MTDNRRSDERVSTNLAVRWNGQSGGHEARIEDLSLGGCFVNTTGRVDPGEVVSLSMKLPSGEWLPLRGEVVSFQQRIGFGVKTPELPNNAESVISRASHTRFVVNSLPSIRQHAFGLLLPPAPNRLV